ncbi:MULTISPECIES: 2-dehydro-3-deoxygalactonokinase [Alphaproteobacteria]|uniref:2-dehydro-3-deoxygalactonokinase n=2 Tax=Alphaproteobacteria TaxID=28211 RepID=A0A512HKB0_9HYPH|nr:MULTISPECIES: 2-dehydro-3-deoxygalactonokinase [Alphaproteobacteria]GEO85888.1 2-dehydro-3-deoxygalactonokinase [Ciceribacter naphthalenivorans]GLR21744.1 2-dehydro-3-deoxygalactonokinase [Ciceribacter naphthalenivorans]GLT04600.1 2-dehydro-3-deoxygalactonokinase [Sphingomonas psychrolutea]
MSTQAAVALVDWGTSNLRVWLVDAAAGVLGDRHSPEGMGTLTSDRFAGVLEAHLAALGAGPDLPVVVAGMAGARAGWVEAPYAEAPAGLIDLYRKAVCAPGIGRDVRILPGVCQRSAGAEDVMRGEETQLLGAVAGGLCDALFCLPGTHSKWVSLEGGRISRFTTVMTGELFQLVSRQSILRLSIGEGRAAAGHPAFRQAVEEALSTDFSLTTRLFSIRAQALLSGADESSAASRLSGLLLGAEIAAMRSRLDESRRVQLIGSGALTELYAAALILAGAEPVSLDGGELVRSGLFAAAKALFPHRFAEFAP